VSCKISEETKQRLIKLVAEMGETLNAHLSELIEADVEMMTDSGKAGSNPGNPGTDLLECPECRSLINNKSFQEHWKKMHGPMTQKDFENFMGEIISDRGGKKFSENEIECFKAIHKKMQGKGFIK